MNFQALLEHMQPSGEGCGQWVWLVYSIPPSAVGGSRPAYSSPGEIGRDQATPSILHDHHAPPTESKLISYACSAVHGFFRSISLSLQSSLQDTLRY